MDAARSDEGSGNNANDQPLWQKVFYALFGVRRRWAFWVAIAVTAAMTLKVGFKDAGHYRGYSAGSILSPDRYRESMGTILYGEQTGMSASQLNKILSGLRGENMPAFLFFLLLLALSIGAAYFVSVAYAKVYDNIDAVLEVDEAREYFTRRYEAELGPYPKSGLFEENFRFKLANFVYDLSIAENWRLQLADAPESFITDVAVPIQAGQDEWFGKTLKLVM